MALILLNSGIGGSSGDTLVTNTGPLLTNRIIYVDSVTGNTAYSGFQRDRPKATLAQGVSVSAAGSIIVLLSTHTETIGTVVTLSDARVVVVGEGSSSGVPTATLACGANAMLAISGAGVQIRNIKFATSTSTNSLARVGVTGVGVKFIGCYFECSGTDENGAVAFRAACTFPVLKSCTFISTATSQTDLPSDGVTVTGDATGLFMDGCVFSDGTYGFSGAAFNGYGLLVNVHAENISLLLGAVMEVSSATVIGYVHVGTATGAGRVT